MREVWFIRHGETDWNSDNRIQGASDVPLNHTGRAQARALAPRLGHEAFDAIYASDLVRASDTARTAVPDATVTLDSRLRELAYGVLEGQSWDRLDDGLRETVRHWQGDPYTRRVPGGESFADLSARVAAFVADLPDRGRFAVFSHGGTIRSAVYGVLGRPSDGRWRLALANTGITRLRFDARGVTVVTLNDHAHLMALD
jgi:2,3-bisphosphoglycerate-dependent phosphoglycerate mutase